MPPRRSCFLQYGAARLRNRLLFQCHHGVPASGASGPGPGRAGLVSMPPRRSCFGAGVPGRGVRRPRFNATTAFLLRSKPICTGSGGMCFNATTAFLLRRGPGEDRSDYFVSMPPRRSCFSPGGPGGSFRDREFQCHHGVPASWSERRFGFSSIPVSMPPRRSCFLRYNHRAQKDQISVSMPPRRSCFSVPDTTIWAVSIVSMPPRRSCFALRPGHPCSSSGSFNATTAFLLPSGCGAT